MKLSWGIKLSTNRVLSCHEPDWEVVLGDEVVVRTERGTEMGRVAFGPVPPQGNERLFKMLRIVTDDDRRHATHRRDQTIDAILYCQDRIAYYKLPMKLVRVDMPHTGARVTFYFSADGRVDFRQLVKDLAHRLRCRVEMRQVGVRDQAKMIGGIGPCGRELCCSSWLPDFTPVSIRMAKAQGLALNPQKVSGVCGRLLCCLAYEHYEGNCRRGRGSKQAPAPGDHSPCKECPRLSDHATSATAESGPAEQQAAEPKPSTPPAEKSRRRGGRRPKRPADKPGQSGKPASPDQSPAKPDGDGAPAKDGDSRPPAGGSKRRRGRRGGRRRKRSKGGGSNNKPRSDS